MYIFTYEDGIYAANDQMLIILLVPCDSYLACKEVSRMLVTPESIECLRGNF